MSDCPHNSRIGDNYGVTCLDCGKPIAGYGYWAEGTWECIHEWTPMGDCEVCTYCERWRLIIEKE